MIIRNQSGTFTIHLQIRDGFEIHDLESEDDARKTYCKYTKMLGGIEVDSAKIPIYEWHPMIPQELRRIK